MAARAVGWSFEGQNPREPEYGMFKEPIITHKLKWPLENLIQWLIGFNLLGVDDFLVQCGQVRTLLHISPGCVTLRLKHSSTSRMLYIHVVQVSYIFKPLFSSTCSCRVSASSPPLPAKKISYHSSSDNNSLVPTSAWEWGYGNKYQQCDTTASLVCSRPS